MPNSPPIVVDPYHILAPFDRQTAGAGGVQRISAARTPRGRVEITVEGIVLPPLHRGPGNPPEGRIRAPGYNDMLRKKQNIRDLQSWLPTIEHYQIAHLWGPGFGDEAAAGMMWAPKEMNLETQNSGVERFLREYANNAIRMGAGVYLEATAVSWDYKDNAADLLHFAEYKVRKLGNGAGYDSFHMTIEAPKPGFLGPPKI